MRSPHLTPFLPAGGLALLLLVSISGAPAPARAQDRAPARSGDEVREPDVRDPAADSLVERWIEAAGGMEAYERLRSARYTLVTELYDPESGRLRRARPRYVRIARLGSGEAARIERWEGDDFIVQVSDGQRVRAWTDGEELGPGEKDFDEARYVTGDVFYWIGLPWKLRDPGVNLRHAGRDEEGRHLVEVGFGAGVGDHQDRWTYLFEDGRSWPVEIRYQEEGRDSFERTFWRDVRSVDGFLFAGERVHVDDEGRVWKILRTTDFELNPDLDPDDFRRLEAPDGRAEDGGAGGGSAPQG